MQPLYGREYATAHYLRTKRYSGICRNRPTVEQFWTDYPLDVIEISAGEIPDDGLRKVTAYPMEHPLECYGFRIEEHEKPGALDAKGLKAAGVQPGPLFQDLKAGKTVTPKTAGKLTVLII